MKELRKLLDRIFDARYWSPMLGISAFVEHTVASSNQRMRNSQKRLYEC